MSTGCFHETRHDTREHPGRKAQAPPVWKALALSPMLGELQFAIELPQVDAGSQGGARHSPPALAEAWLHVRQALGGDLVGKFLEVFRLDLAFLRGKSGQKSVSLGAGRFRQVRASGRDPTAQVCCPTLQRHANSCTVECLAGRGSRHMHNGRRGDDFVGSAAASFCRPSPGGRLRKYRQHG